MEHSNYIDTKKIKWKSEIKYVPFLHMTQFELRYVDDTGLTPQESQKWEIWSKVYSSVLIQNTVDEKHV